jgi:prepilin peptidase CpaA
MSMLRYGFWACFLLLAAVAGVMDWQSRRIPNWLTVSGLIAGVAINTLTRGWFGAKASLLGTCLGLGLLLPFVLIRSLGAGDWKLVGAMGAFVGPQELVALLFFAIVAAGCMALILILWKGRVGVTLRNIGQMFGSLLSLHLPGSEVSLDNPESLKIPFGVAVAIAAVIYTADRVWRGV